MSIKVIAEVGSNWRTLDDCKMSIRLAKEAGANACKFQFFNHDELYGDGKGLDKIGTSPYMPSDWLWQLKHECDNHRIEFMCTAFSPQGYSKINYMIQNHKIASAELTDVNILNTVNKLKKPVYLSTAGSHMQIEIKNALLYLTDCPVTIMFCVGDYPARIVDFRKLDQMMEYFGSGYDYGFSDHSLDVLNLPMLAKQRGCKVIEKHVNFTFHQDTPDAAHSLNFEEFKAMCLNLNDPAPTVNELELITNTMMKRQYKRRFIAMEDINPGDKFKIGVNVGYYRATMDAEGPVLTFRPWDISNKTALLYKKQGDVICYADIET